MRRRLATAPSKSYILKEMDIMRSAGRPYRQKGKAGSMTDLVSQDEGYGSTVRQGCPFHDIRQKLRRVGLRPTRQRVSLGWVLFAKGDRHLTVEELHEEAVAANVPVSLATVYNTLHQFTEAGLIRVLAVESAKTYFDTNTSDHHHFYIEGENRVFDIEGGPVTVNNLPEPPEGMEIANVDIVVRLRPKSRI